MNITDEQKNIIESTYNKKILVKAGPGTGKTEVVARRLIWLLNKENLNPRNILILSFSRAAVKALIDRIQAFTNQSTSDNEELEYLSIRTFDSWTFRMLIMLGYDKIDLLGNTYEKNIELLCNELKEVKRDKLEELNIKDLLNLRHLIIDEYQDLTGIRARLVQILLDLIYRVNDSDIQGFTILGDPQQAIYNWMIREKDVAIFIQTSGELVEWIEKKFKNDLNILILTVNKRSEKKISNLISQASTILNNSTDTSKDPVTEIQTQLYNQLPSEDLCDLLRLIDSEISCRNVAILCRNNSHIIELSEQLYQMLDKESINKIESIFGNSPHFIPSWIAIVLYKIQTQQLSKNQFIDVFDSCFQMHKYELPFNNAELAWISLLKVARFSEDTNSISVETLRERIIYSDNIIDENYIKNKILITTIHKSKGLEFDHIKIVNTINNFQDDIYEEGRILYVGLSRAKTDLKILDLDIDGNFYLKEFNQSTNKRWYRYNKTNKLIKLEIGLEDDLIEDSIIHCKYMGDKSKIAEIQHFLMENEKELIGQKVYLKKYKHPNNHEKFLYGINLKCKNGEELLLGYMSESFTLDLVELKLKNQMLPACIYNLYIKKIKTCVSLNSYYNDIPEPWCYSKFWLGLIIHGVGEFKYPWKNN